MAKSKKDQPNDKRIYCGPSLPGFRQFTVIEREPMHLKVHMEACPQIEKMMVPLNQLNHTRLKLSVKGSHEQGLYSAITAYLKGVK